MTRYEILLGKPCPPEPKMSMDEFAMALLRNKEKRDRDELQNISQELDQRRALIDIGLLPPTALVPTDWL